MDKYLKLFQDIQLSLLIGAEGPTEAKYWRLLIEKILNERELPFATFAIDDKVERWRRGQHQDKFVCGLRDMFRQSKVTLGIKDYLVLVERVRRV
ncbi:hypothetical protein IEQ34_009218 [Dendrobium chrysotoxum]|uniref:Uncharacterized protein n=1 Tax=Dendrobium chrysotoxum TaxID=161865 RepID=A0AAV7H180_DENCH|nr:hypothetical protein IEQ34_009218 [Dendrobium chrysotoxum]